MAMINTGIYEFKSLYNLMDFVKPLIVEGYSVAINTIYKDNPFENDIDRFTVSIGNKGHKIAIYDSTEEACDNED